MRARSRSRSSTIAVTAPMTNSTMNASSIPMREWTRCRRSMASSPDAAAAPTVAAVEGVTGAAAASPARRPAPRCGAGHRRRDAPAERVVTEDGDAGADQPLAEGWMRAAGEVGDAAHRLGAEDVPAGVAGVEDLVEDELDRPAQADETQERGRPSVTRARSAVSRRVQPRTAGAVGGGDAAGPRTGWLSILAPRGRATDPLLDSVPRLRNQ